MPPSLGTEPEALLPRQLASLRRIWPLGRLLGVMQETLLFVVMVMLLTGAGAAAAGRPQGAAARVPL